MEEADSGESGPHRDPRHSEDPALKDRDQPGIQEESLPAGRKPSDAELDYVSRHRVNPIRTAGQS